MMIWTTAKSVWQQFKDGELQLIANSLSFSTILCLVPFLAVTLAVLQMTAGLEAIYPKVENLLLFHLREAAGYEVTKIIKYSIRNVHGGTLGVTGALFLIVTSFRLLHDMEMAINRVWHIRNRRPLHKRLFAYWMLLLVLPIMLSVYVAMSSLDYFKMAKRLFPAGLTNAAIMISILFVIFKIVPNIKVRFFPALIGALFSALGLVIVHKGFILIAKSFFAYNKIYGGFAALPLMLLWILALWYVFLAGVAISSRLNSN